ncbi:signal peptidase I [Nisaea sp.]|uniref:signal peptidase I n=1 Tax=Nisaea sp. TaxID=2024842 RepID=UPI003B515584
MREFIKTLVYAILIAVAFRTVAYEPFNIPSGSMFPTLLVGDYLFVSKPSYGYSRHSLPFSPALFDGRILASAPERGDVAVFKKPTDESTDYIKRVIGLPGDRIQMKQGRLHINGEMVPRRRVEDYVMTDPYGRAVSIPQFIETLPNGVEHHILEQLGDRAQHDNTREFEIPEGFYFMMGDNRDNSLDSRDGSVGLVPFENFVGRAEFLFFSTDGSARGYEFWKWPFATRYSRLFQAIE